jgi:hypothetical protein
MSILIVFPSFQKIPSCSQDRLKADGVRNVLKLVVCHFGGIARKSFPPKKGLFQNAVPVISGMFDRYNRAY